MTPTRCDHARGVCLSPDPECGLNAHLLRDVVQSGPRRLVHEVGQLHHGTQRCRRCGRLLVEGVEVGFPPFRRVVEIPDGLALLAPDRPLANDEVMC